MFYIPNFLTKSLVIKNKGRLHPEEMTWLSSFFFFVIGAWFGMALRSKTWFELCPLGCMLSAGREVKIEIPMYTCRFKNKRALRPFRIT